MVIAVADEKKTTDAVNELCPIALSEEDSALLDRVLKRERRREAVRDWLGVIGKRAKEYAVLYLTIGGAIVAGREHIAALLHWLGFGGGK
jgi:hypothetical protein